MLKDKALENLAAGELLFERGLVNAAVSRLHYAMFQAAAHRLDLLGIPPDSVQSGATRWEHAMVANNTLRLRGRPTDGRLYHGVMRLRLKADYFDRGVSSVEVSRLREEIADFVRELTR